MTSRRRALGLLGWLAAGCCGGLAGAARCHAGESDDLLAPLACDEQGLNAALRQIGPQAKSVASPHFLVVHTAQPEPARGLAQQLEAVYRAHVRFVAEWQLPAHAPKHKLEVWYFGSWAEFQKHLATTGTTTPDLLGCYEPQSNRLVLFDFDTHPELAAVRATLETADPQERIRLRARLERRRTILVTSVIQHEAAHQIELNMGLVPAFDRAPIWLTEGLATLFEAAGPEAGSGPPLNSYRLFEFKKLYGGTPPALGELRRLIQDDAAWCGGPCYPLAWAVVRYLHDEQRPALAALLQQLMSSDGLPRDPTERAAALEKSLGPLDERWAERLYTRTMALPLDPSAFGE